LSSGCSGSCPYPLWSRFAIGCAIKTIFLLVVFRTVFFKRGREEEDGLRRRSRSRCVEECCRWGWFEQGCKASSSKSIYIGGRRNAGRGRDCARGREDERKVPGRWRLRNEGCFTAEEDPNTVVCQSIDSRSPSSVPSLLTGRRLNICHFLFRCCCGGVGLCCSQSRRRTHREMKLYCLDYSA
jgi:hypothetical protein